MKNKPFVLILFLLLSSSALFARTIPGPPQVINPAASMVRHIGKMRHHRYPIGSQEEPVTVDEYCAFLNTKDAFRNIGFYLSDSDYYDDALMGGTWLPYSDAPIVKTRYGSSWRYYEANKGEGNFIIDSLVSPALTKAFDAWRKNPTVQELCDYINCRIAARVDDSYLEDAMALKNRYPEASEDIFNKANDIVSEVYQWIPDSKGCIYGPFSKKLGFLYFYIHDETEKMGNFQKHDSCRILRFSNNSKEGVLLPGMPVYAALDDRKKDASETLQCVGHYRPALLFEELSLYGEGEEFPRYTD